MMGKLTPNRYLLIGGPADGCTYRPEPQQVQEGVIRVVMPIETDVAAVADDTSALDIEAKVETYIIWDLHYMPDSGNKISYCVARHEDLSDAAAFDMIMNSYSPQAEPIDHLEMPEYLDSRFVLVSYYNSCTEKDPCWEVYGHIDVGHNICIGSYKKQEHAQQIAMRYGWIGVPVVAGGRGNWESVLEKLKRKDDS